MATAYQNSDEAFEMLEASILPHLSASLDALLETASLARPGIDAESFAERLRAIAGDLVTIDAELAALKPARPYAQESYRAA